MRVTLFVFIAALFAYPQADRSNYPYILRLAHETPNRYSCVLLQNTGAFHFEINGGEETKVLEGTLDTDTLAEIERELQDPSLASLTQSQIEEPLIRGEEDKLQVSIVQGGSWQSLTFDSSYSQRPFEHALKPMVRWMDGLHKLPHRDLTEDEGKNSCLPPKIIVLKKRTFGAAESAASVPPLQTSPPGSSHTVAAVKQPVSPAALLHVYSLSLEGTGARQTCALISQSGKFRFEARVQKAEGKPVKAKILAGEISPTDLQELRKLLDAPALANLPHREPRGGSVPVMGDVLNLTISRPGGDQRLFLSGGYARQFGAFFGGDGPITIATPLMKFLAENVEKRSTAIPLTASSGNNCAGL